MLVRRSGDADSPRILQAFNDPIENWLDFFCFTTFTDRDGKYQLSALSESAFDPLARATKFMLTEEAHHLFVGESGVSRILTRTCELMKSASNGDVMAAGGIPLDLIQKYINTWYSASLDLFGGEDSSNAATYFAAGLKGRHREAADPNIKDHKALEGIYNYTIPADGGFTNKEIPLRRAMNLVLRDSYVDDCKRVLDKWNGVISRMGIDHKLILPSERFHRGQGVFSYAHYDPAGNTLADEQWHARHAEFLPTDKDREFVQSLMVPVIEPGKFAGWIAPPEKGINGQSVEFEYVQFDGEPAIAGQN
jgi:benzoyl-CoA 2,3-dioxygenase component B